MDEMCANTNETSLVFRDSEDFKFLLEKANKVISLIDIIYDLMKFDIIESVEPKTGFDDVLNEIFSNFPDLASAAEPKGDEKDYAKAILRINNAIRLLTDCLNSKRLNDKDKDMIEYYIEDLDCSIKTIGRSTLLLMPLPNVEFLHKSVESKSHLLSKELVKGLGFPDIDEFRSLVEKCN